MAIYKKSKDGIHFYKIMDGKRNILHVLYNPEMTVRYPTQTVTPGTYLINNLDKKPESMLVRNCTEIEFEEAMIGAIHGLGITDIYKPLSIWLNKIHKNE